MAPRREYIYTTRNTVTVRFETRRKPICGKLEIYRKSGRLSAIEHIRGKANAILAVGNWTYKLFLYDETDDVCELEGLDDLVGYNLRERNANAADRIISLELDGLSSEEIRSVQRIVREVMQGRRANNTIATLSSSKIAARQPRFVDEVPRQSALAASMICSGATALAESLVSRAKEKSENIDQITRVLQANQEHRILPSSPNYVEVDPRLRAAVVVAKGATTALAVGTALGVRGLCAVAGFVGSTFGPAVKTGASRLIASSDSPRDIQNARNNVEDFCNVAGGILSGIGTVLGGVEQSASILAPSVFRLGGGMVGQSFGSEAGILAEDVLHTAGNVVAAGYNLNCVRSAKVLAVKSVQEPTEKDCYLDYH